MKRFLLALLILTVCISVSACSSKTTDSTIPDGYLKAENEAVEYYFLYPDTWEVDRNDGMISIKTNVGSSSAATYATISVQTFGLEDSSIGANDYWETFKTDLNTAYGSLVSIQSEKQETTLGNTIANRNAYLITMGDNVYKFDQVICVRYGNVYLVTLSVLQDSYDQVAEDFEDVLTNFVFSK